MHETLHRPVVSVFSVHTIKDTIALRHIERRNDSTQPCPDLLDEALTQTASPVIGVRSPTGTTAEARPRSGTSCATDKGPAMIYSLYHVYSKHN